MEMETLLKRNSFFSCYCRATKRSSCNDLEKMNLLKKVVMNSWNKLLKNKVFSIIVNRKLKFLTKKNALNYSAFLNIFEFLQFETVS